MKIKCILLDLGGVVFNSTGQSNEIIDWKIVSQLNHKYGHALNIGETSVQPFLKEYNQMTQQSLNTAEFLKNIFDSLEFNEDLIEYLRKIAPIHILSDNYRENIDYISKRYHFDKWSEQQFYSFDFALTKSDGPQIFKQVLDALKVDAANVIFIDDSPIKIVNAEKCGIKALHFSGNQSIFNDLGV